MLVTKETKRGTRARMRVRVFKNLFLNYQASDLTVENRGKHDNIQITTMECSPEMVL